MARHHLKKGRYNHADSTSKNEERKYHMNENIKSVAYGNGVYMAAAGDRILKSTDGENWELSRMTSGTSGNSLTRVVFGGGKFLVCGECYFFITSDNGTTWTEFGAMPSPFPYAAYGDEKFYLACSGGSGVAQVDLSTMNFSWLNYTTMGEIAYLNHTLYTIKQDSTDANLYRLNSSNVWEIVVSGIPTGSNRTLKSVGNRLFMGMGTYTFEFQKEVEDADFTSFKWVSMIYGKMLDACEANGKAYVMTASALYEEEKEVTSGTDYVCCCTGGDSNIHLYTPSAHSTYTTRSDNLDIRDVAYGNGVYIAAAVDKILKSTDCETWTVCKTVSGTGHELNKVLYGDGTFLVYGQSYYYLSSDAGVTWTEQASASYLRSAAYGGGYFWMCTMLGGLLKINPSTLEPNRLNNDPMGDIAYWDGKLFGVSWNPSDQGVYIFVESDNTWFENIVNLPQGDSSRTLRSAGGRLFVGNNATTLEVVKSPTGVYSLQDTAIAGKMVDACEFGVKAYIITPYHLFENGEVVANSGRDKYLCCFLGGDGDIHMMLDTGEISAITPSPDGTGYNIHSIAYGNGVYIGVTGDCILRSTDCENWTVVKQRDSSVDNNHMTKVVYGGGAFLVCGEAIRYMTLNNGSEWTQGTSASYMDCAAYGDGKFLLSSSVNPGTLLVDAATWEPTWVDYGDSMSDLAYWNGQFVGVKNLVNIPAIYTLDLSTNTWVYHAVNLPTLSKAEKRLRAAGDNLYLGFNNSTAQVAEDWTLSQEWDNYLVDAVQLDGSIFLLTEKKFYQGSRLEDESPYDPYCCMAAGGEDGNVHLFTVGGTHTAYQPVQYVDEYDIKEIAYGNGIYMAAAGDKILKSTDGQNWTLAKKTVATPPAKADVSRIAYGGGSFLVCGTGRCYMTTNDGETWSDFGYGSLMENVSYGDGSFLVTCSASAGGTFKVDAATFSRTSVCYESMGETAFVNNGFYGVKPLSDADQGLYKLTGSSWTKIYDNIGTGERCLRAANGRLLLGINGATYEFIKNAAGEFSSLALLPDVRGQMVDACGMDGETYILSGARFYQGTLTTHAFEEGRYRCITPGKFAKMNVSAPTSCILLSDGGSCAVYEPVEPVTEYRIRSVSFNDGVYIAATSDRVLKSFDGHHWFSVKKLVRPDRTELKKVVLGDGKFLVCGQYDYFISSDNGLSWKEGSSFHAMEYAAYGNGKFITTSSRGWTQQIDAATLERSVLESLELVDDVACWNGRFVAVKNDVSDRNIYVLTSDNIWEAHELINCPALTRAEKTLRMSGGVMYLGINNDTKAIWFHQNQYEVYDIINGEYLVDSCELEETGYLLTSSTLYEDEYPVKSAPSGRAFVCCTAGKVAIATRSTNAAGDQVDTFSDPSSDGSSERDTYLPGSIQAKYDKETTATYTVITDTHGRPWGSRTANFDLGDNTRSYGKENAFVYMDPVETTNADVILYGNHDVSQNQRNAQRLQIWPDDEKKIVFYGFDSCADNRNGFGDYEIPLYQIKDMARDIQKYRHHNWDIAVLTHIPLFKYGGRNMVDCWKEDVPKNTDLLKKVLYAFQTHTGVAVDGEAFGFSRSDGHVIGCFCGHIHNSVIWAEPYVYLDDGNDSLIVDENYGRVYMEAFITNGEKTFTPNETEDSDSGLYQPETQSIHIVCSANAKNRTVNDHPYDPPTYCYVGGNEIKPEPVYANAYGALRMTEASSARPKFHTDGTYLGYSYNDNPGVSETDGKGNIKSTWEVIGTIYTDARPHNVTGIRFGSDGLLRYYWENGVEKQISNYKNANTSFDSYGFHWEFVNGKYVHPKSSQYQFSSSSGSYLAFDNNNRYIGWSNKPNHYLTGGRANDIASRSWSFYGAIKLYVDSVMKYYPVTSIVFDTDGKLQYFVYGNNYRYNDVAGTVKFVTDNGYKWVFKNRVLSEVYNDSDSWYLFGENLKMDFTYYKYKMNVENGYLVSYYEDTTPPGPLYSGDYIYNPKLTYEENGWQCNKKVYYYRTVEAAHNGSYFASEDVDYFQFGHKNSGKYSIDSLKHQTRGYFAQIGGQFFYCDGVNGYRMVELI